MTEQAIRKAAEDYVNPFRHQLHLGEEEGLINDLVAFGMHLKTKESELLQECLDTFKCQDQTDKELKLKIENYLGCS